MVSRMDMRIVRFCRSTYDVLMCSGSDVPVITFVSMPMHLEGLYRFLSPASLP